MPEQTAPSTVLATHLTDLRPSGIGALDAGPPLNEIAVDAGRMLEPDDEYRSTAVFDWSYRATAPGHSTGATRDNETVTEGSAGA